MPTKTWAQGEEVLAADMNTYLQKQVVSTFPTAAARDSAIPSPSEGMICYQADTKLLMLYRNGLWRPPIGTVVATGVLALPDINTSAVGTQLVLSAENGVSYPYDTLLKIDLVMYSGFGGSPTTFQAGLQRISDLGVLINSPNPLGAPAAQYTSCPLTMVHGIAPNVNTGFNVLLNFISGSNIHNGGSVSFQHVVHL